MRRSQIAYDLALARDMPAVLKFVQSPVKIDRRRIQLAFSLIELAQTGAKRSGKAALAFRPFKTGAKRRFGGGIIVGQQ